MATNIRSNEIGGIYIQSGNGIPSHLSPIGGLFIDVNVPNGYLSYGNGNWRDISGSGSTGFDVYVTGGTYSNGTATYTNNTGGTFSINGFLTGNYLSLSGGTVTGLTNFTNGLSANTLSANTINVNDYVDFATGASNPSNIAGRTYYSNADNSLTYKPITPLMDVSVNIGQEELIYCYNNSGVNILNGQACYISGSISGISTIALAVASAHTTAQSYVSGLATHNINNGAYGFITNFGLVHDLNITGVTEGSVVYLSETIAGGYTYNRTNLKTSSRANIIGRIIQTGTTTGIIGVSIRNEDPLSILTTRETNLNLLNTISTGLYVFTGMTLNSSTTFNIPPVSGWIVQNTGSFALNGDIINIIYLGQTGLTTPYLATSNETHVLITSANTVMYSPTEPTAQQRRENIHLGHLLHSNRTSIEYVINLPDYNVSPTSQLRDMFEPINLINQGVYPSANGANLNINVSSGELYGMGIGWVNNNLEPNEMSITASTSTTFKYKTQTGGTSSDVSLIDPTSYDVGGVITAIPGGNNVSTNQRIYMYPNNQVRIQYGQTTYTNLTNAITGVANESFIEFDNLIVNAVLIGVLSVRKGATALNSSVDAKFTLASKFGEVVGGTGGISTTTLQQAYDNSTNPEILINSTLGGLSIKNGSGNPDITTNLFEGLNSGGTTSSFIRADGALSAVTISAITMSATTYINLPIDVHVTGGTYSNGTATYTNNTGGTFTVTGLTTPFTGGTVNGETIFAGGISANTISATTYYSGGTSLIDVLTKDYYKRITTNFSTTSSGFTDIIIDGASEVLEFNVMANKQYVIEGYFNTISFTTSGQYYNLVVPSGSTLRINGVGTTIDQVQRGFFTTTTSGNDVGPFQTTNNSSLNGFVELRGSFNTTQSGITKIQLRSTTSSTSRILAGSWVRLIKID